MRRFAKEFICNQRNKWKATKRPHGEVRPLIIINELTFYFLLSARPNGLSFAKSTNTGAATKIEE